MATILVYPLHSPIPSLIWTSLKIPSPNTHAESQTSSHYHISFEGVPFYYATDDNKKSWQRCGESIALVHCWWDFQMMQEDERSLSISGSKTQAITTSLSAFFWRMFSCPLGRRWHEEDDMGESLMLTAKNERQKMTMEQFEQLK